MYQSSLFDAVGVIHGFSTKHVGDMRDTEKRNAFLLSLGIQEESLVWQEQIHGDVIRIVTGDNHGKIIKGADGLVYKKLLADPPIVLSVHVADCVPLVFFDPVQNIIGVAHAGWKGTALHIGQKMILTMESLGSKTGDIRITIGPSVCGSCYEVAYDREQTFRKEFPQHPDILSQNKEKTFLNLGLANKYDLMTLGVQEQNIDYDPSLCTSCHIEDFYSFRKNGNRIEGEIMGVIGFGK